MSLNKINEKISDIFRDGFSEKKEVNIENKQTITQKSSIDFSYLFFSDVRKDISNIEKYNFARHLVEFADQSSFKAIYFPERHFYEFGSIYANNGIMASYFASITRNLRLRTAAITNALHHPVRVVEDWAMIDILSNGRVDLGFGSGWNKADFILSPDTYKNRTELRRERIPIIQKLWRGEQMTFVGPDNHPFKITVHPRPLQKELNVWYVCNAEEAFMYAGSKGYNIFTMLYSISLLELGKKINIYRNARKKAGFNPATGIISLMMHTLVHPDQDWVNKVVSAPFKAYIRSSLVPHMKSQNKIVNEEEINKMVEYSYARYFKTGGIFGSIEHSQKIIDEAISVGVNEIAFLQDFGIDYSAVKESLCYLEELVKNNI